MLKFKSPVWSAVLGAAFMVGLSTGAQAQSLSPAVSTASQITPPPVQKPVPTAATQKGAAVKGKKFKDLSPAERAQVVAALQKMLHNMYVLSKQFATPSVASPNAMGGAGTSLFASMSAVTNWDGTPNPDASANVGVSFGDPRRYVGAVVNIANGDMGFNGNSFGQTGGFGFRINRYLADWTSVAVGANNIVGWGASASSSKSYYATVTQNIPLRILPITLNVGAGTGSFDYFGPTTSDNIIRPFAGIGILLYKGLSLSADWATLQYNLGLTYAFVWHIPFFFSAGWMNIGERGGQTSHGQFTGGIAYPFAA